MKRGILAAAAALALVAATPFAAHADDAPPPADPAPAAPPPVVAPPIPSDPIVLPPPETPAGTFVPPQTGGTGTPPPVWDGPPPPGTLLPEFGVPYTSYTCYYAWPGAPCAPIPNGPMLISDAQAIAMVAKANSGGLQWDVQMAPDGTVQMRPLGSSEPWTSVGEPGVKRIGVFTPPGTVKYMWDVFALLDPPPLKHLDPIG